MPVHQMTSIRIFKHFATAMHSGKMYIRQLFRYGQLQTFHAQETYFGTSVKSESFAKLFIPFLNLHSTKYAKIYFTGL